MTSAINAVPYQASIKIGIQFKRQFWEEDDSIYGGITYTDLPIRQISYPSTNFGSTGEGVALGAYTVYAYEFTSLLPKERLQKAIEYGAQIDPQYEAEYENGMSVGWHWVPWVLGCFGIWSEAAPGWQRGPCQPGLR
jgi:monoamine oxidase